MLLELNELLAIWRKEAEASPLQIGDDESVGMRVMRRDVSFDDLGEPENQCFGEYLGVIGGKHTVAVIDFFTWERIRQIRYESLDEMRKCWVID